MQNAHRYALKEWESVCARLAAGEATVLLRKGGILEKRDGFELEHREFFLFPTLHHQSSPGAPAKPDQVELSLYAEVESDIHVEDLDRVRRLEGLHAVPWEDVEKRFNYRTPGLHVLALRIHRLSAPRRIPNVAAYDGCVSWVELEQDLPVETSGPVLGDEPFRERIDRMKTALAGAGREA